MYVEECGIVEIELEIQVVEELWKLPSAERTCREPYYINHIQRIN